MARSAHGVSNERPRAAPKQKRHSGPVGRALFSANVSRFIAPVHVRIDHSTQRNFVLLAITKRCCETPRLLILLGL